MSAQREGATAPERHGERNPTDIKRISTLTTWYELGEGQRFYETPKAYEIWQEQPLQRVKRFDKKRVYWVVSK